MHFCTSDTMQHLHELAEPLIDHNGATSRFMIKDTQVEHLPSNMLTEFIATHKLSFLLSK